MDSIFGLDEHFYHGSIKRYVALFGSIFSDLYIKRVSDDGKKESAIKVPIRYGSGNMYLKVPQDQSREVNQINRILPAMGFALDSIYKDVSRKTNPMNRIQAASFNGTLEKKFQFNRVPYNLLFQLEIKTKNTDDMMQIVEQIIPAFDGNLSVTIQDNTGAIVEQDIIIVLNEIKMSDNYEDEMQSRIIEWTIMFELKGYLYKKTQNGIIVQSVEIQGGGDYENMETLEIINNQAELQNKQYLLSDFVGVVDTIPEAPVKKARGRKKKE